MKGPEQPACHPTGESVRGVAAYVRVSSRSQDAAYQRAAIERAALARGDSVGAWFSDVASGRSMDRPGLAGVLQAICDGAVRRLWVWRLDRLTRSGIVDTLQVVELLRKHGCECASVADGFELDGPAAPVVLAVLAWAAQLERRKIRENQAAARERMAAQGRSWGRPPRATPEVRAQIRELRAGGATYREISRSMKLSVSHIGEICRQNDP